MKHDHGLADATSVEPPQIAPRMSRGLESISAEAS